MCERFGSHYGLSVQNLKPKKAEECVTSELVTLTRVCDLKVEAQSPEDLERRPLGVSNTKGGKSV